LKNAFVGAVAVSALVQGALYGDSLGGRGSNTQPSNWEADTELIAALTQNSNAQNNVTYF